MHWFSEDLQFSGVPKKIYGHAKQKAFISLLIEIIFKIHVLRCSLLQDTYTCMFMH